MVKKEDNYRKSTTNLGNIKNGIHDIYIYKYYTLSDIVTH